MWMDPGPGARALARSRRVGRLSWASTKFDNAIANFADAHADQNERDYAELHDAVAHGRVEAITGV
jgi:hypothetical protein